MHVIRFGGTYFNSLFSSAYCQFVNFPCSSIDSAIRAMLSAYKIVHRIGLRISTVAYGGVQRLNNIELSAEP